MMCVFKDNGGHCLIEIERTAAFGRADNRQGIHVLYYRFWMKEVIDRPRAPRNIRINDQNSSTGLQRLAGLSEKESDVFDVM